MRLGRDGSLGALGCFDGSSSSCGVKGAVVMASRRRAKLARAQGARVLLVVVAVITGLVAVGGPPAAAGTVQAIENPGFETGTIADPAPWVTGPEPNQMLFSTVAPRTGSRSADLCNRNNCHESISQSSVAVPDSFAAATLRFSVRFDTTEHPDDAGSCFDGVGVGLGPDIDTDGVAGDVVCNGDQPSGSYRDVVLDVTDELDFYRGRALIAQIVAWTDESAPSHMWVDDVMLTFTIPEAPSPPVNVTAISTGGGSAMVTWGAPAAGQAPTSYTVTPSTGSPQVVSATARTATFTGLAGSAVTFTVAAISGQLVGSAATSNAVNPAVSAPLRDLVSDRQYQLTGSNGASWVDLDPVNLSTTFTPPAAGRLLLDANVDLWTATSGVNQDVAIVVAGGVYESGTVVGWKESGGFAGTFSPNAAAVNTTTPVQAAVSYTVKLAWKTNQATSGTIYAGAGPIGRGFSPTRLTATFLPDTQSATTVASINQFQLTNSNGTTWAPMSTRTDGTPTGPLTLPFTPNADGIAAITGNADLWTWNAGYNQDIALKVSGGTYGGGQIVAWKESGGFAGTFSPNAALVEARIPVVAGVDYTAELVWKANKAMPAGVKISAGAGNTGSFSPTTLTLVQEPTSAVASHASATQYRLDGSDGATWQNLNTATGGQGPLSVTYQAPANGYVHLIGNTDLWTYAAGYNQDIGIEVTAPPADPGTAPEGIVTWKESGGFAGTFSPNAAAVEGLYPVMAGQSYTFTLVWKINKPAIPQISISAGAGNPLDFSPTRLDLTFRSAA